MRIIQVRIAFGVTAICALSLAVLPWVRVVLPWWSWEDLWPLGVYWAGYGLGAWVWSRKMGQPFGKE